ncbi:MAG: DUF3048 domain-containing protein [Actinobacteria bacterium]|nr:DUF3048 domain-containing protein [Actinomycetota bacterium]
MFSKKIATVTVALISIAVIAVAVLNPNTFSSVENPFLKSEPTNSISGREGGDGPVLVVKIDDTKASHPQIGIEDADLVYIEQVEGGLTRLAAVFSSKIPTRIGSVRSSRVSDIELLAQFGRVGFAYSGAQSKFRPVLAAANLENLSAERNSAQIYTTDPSRIQPYAMVLRADLLLQSIAEKGITLAQSKAMGWTFGSAPETGRRVSNIKLLWPASSYDAAWSAQENRWLLSHQNQPNLSDSGIQLGASTLVIQKVLITPSIYKDKVGGVTPFSATVGTGTGYIARNGKVFPARWNRATADSGTTWTDLAGEEITFEKGQIWVALVDKEPVFTDVIADATKPGSK